MEQANLARQYQHFVTEDDNLILDKPITKQDIWEILSHFAKDKSLGPDSWTVEFFTIFSIWWVMTYIVWLKTQGAEVR